MALISLVISFLALHGLALAFPGHSPQASNAKTSLTFLYQNNLNASDDINHAGAILLDPMSSRDGAAACNAIGESLMSRSALQAHSSDFYHQLAYLEYSGKPHRGQQYYIQDGTVATDQRTNGLIFSQQHFGRELPVLCTQSSNQNSASNAIATSKSELTVTSNSNTYTGFRNQKSFRFIGIPYADPFARFEYSTVYSKRGQTLNATTYGSSCAQAYSPDSNENCLYLNIQSPYLPRAASRSNLRPVLFSIHGGGFTGGSGGSSSGLDTGNLASRYDIVGVEINYRLSTLGFLAIPNTPIKGNFGIADQITALRWVRANIANFGGDPDRITIIGESAGAGSVRALLGSPPVIQENLIAGAIAQSNLGGGVTLGLEGNYGTTYSSYYTIPESYAVAGQQIFAAAGCTHSTVVEQIACLKAVSALTIQNLPTVARYVVQDGTYVDTEQLIVSTRNGSTAHVPVIFGTTANDGASFSTYPETPATSLVDGLVKSLGISTYYAQAIVDSGLFPFYDTGNLTLDAFNVSQRVATDTTFRCVDEATVYAGAKSGAFERAWYYTMERTYQGYDPNNLGLSGLSAGPITPSYPSGDPEFPYFRLHGSDLGFTYGNQYPLRDEKDLLASQIISGYFASLARTGNPNFDQEYLKVRGYVGGAEWESVRGVEGPAMRLDWDGRGRVFPELEQCGWLNYSVGYYLDGGR